MLRHSKRAAEAGVSLVEIAISLVIMALAIAAGMPSISQWIQNTRIRTAAEGIKSGLQRARAEAVRQAANVEFILDNPGVVAGTGWDVRVVRTDTIVESKPSGEGSSTVQLTTTPSGATTVTFSALGRPTTNADGSAALTQVDADVPTTILSAADSRDLRITISSGGQIRMCDPNVSTTGDPRKC